MLRLHTSSILTARLFRACWIAVYAAIALPGSGGLHALAPHQHVHCCPETSAPIVHSHHGCTHQHSHASSPQSQTTDGALPPCESEDCFICRFEATPALPVTLAPPPPHIELQTALEVLSPICHTPQWAAGFLIRGPPA